MDEVPTPSRPPRGAGARPPPPPGPQFAPQGGGGGATATPPTRENKSTGATRACAAPIANPIHGDEIVVGSWAHSPVGGGRAGPKAVIGIFDRRGHLNFRIVARTVAGIPVPAPGGTSVSLNNINLRWPTAAPPPLLSHDVKERFWVGNETRRFRQTGTGKGPTS